MQALETVKLLTGIGSNLKGKLMVCDFKEMYITKIDVFKRPNCLACRGETKTSLAKERLVWLCGQKTANVNPPHTIEMKLNEIHNRLKEYFKVLVKSTFVIVFEYDNGVEVSLFKPGRMLIKNVKDEKTALSIYEQVIAKLEIPRS
jgi:adenylyltransferase/sulfurtransferase